jgi:uncharacterized protein (TIGR00251 family)
VKIEVHAKPRAKKSRVVGFRGETLDVSIAAPPVDGAANEELVRFLAEVLDVPKRQIVLVRGESSRTKLVEVHGLEDEVVRARLAAALAE